MSHEGVIAVLLPATSLASHIPFADGRRLVAAGVPVAIATDFCSSIHAYSLYQALSFAIVPQDQFSFRQGAGEALSGGLAALPLWLAYLWLVQRALRGGSPVFAGRGGLGGPPAEPAGVGARIGPSPSSRSAGAEARPPEDPR